MFFQVYGPHALAQWGMLLVVLLGLNPYKEDVFVDQKYYKDAMARADV